MNNLFKESANLLLESSDRDIKDYQLVYSILEDVDSPVTRKLHEQLFQDVLDKKHIDFGDIPKSQGDILKYSGYNSMMNTLATIRKLSEDNKNVLKYVDTVDKAISNLVSLSYVYKKGFESRSEFVAIEYNSYVYLCVEATTALIYSFVDYIKDPNTKSFDIKIVNNKLRADEFYFEQLNKFNKLQEKRGLDYRKTLEAYCNNGKNNFIGTTALGVTVVLGVALAIVPITREIVYQIYNTRSKLSDYLELQANFLELNRSSVESNSTLDIEKKKAVISKQEKLAKKLKSLSDKLRVTSAVGVKTKETEIKKDNKHLSLDAIRKDVAQSDFEIM